MSISRLPGRPVFRSRRDVGVVDSLAHVVRLLLEPICDLSFREPGTDQLVDGFAQPDRAFLPQALHGSGNVVGETDRGSHPTIVHQDANYRAS